MKLQWMWPDPTGAFGGPYLNGEFYIKEMELSRPQCVYAVRDQRRGWNILRVEFETPEEIAGAHAFMENMVEVAHIKYNDLKEKNGKTATV